MESNHLVKLVMVVKVAVVLEVDNLLTLILVMVTQTLVVAVEVKTQDKEVMEVVE